MGVVEFLICAPLVLAALIVVVLLGLAVGRSRETAAPGAARPINKWGVAYFVAAALVGLLITIVLVPTSSLGHAGSVLCVFSVAAIAAPFVLVALYRALRWAGIL